jgi:hypothetical protein
VRGPSNSAISWFNCLELICMAPGKSSTGCSLVGREPPPSQVIDEKDSILVEGMQRYYDSSRTSERWIKTCFVDCWMCNSSRVVEPKSSAAYFECRFIQYPFMERC